MTITYTQVIQAVARGWCSEENAHKEMDAVLATAIADEVWRAIGGYHGEMSERAINCLVKRRKRNIQGARR